jgi:uncharacterized RDD family membrane protein YckC
MEKVNPSGLIRRGFAYLVDFVALFIFWAFVAGKSFLISANWSTYDGNWVTDINYQNPGNALLFLLLLVVYFAVCEAVSGRTLGKVVLGIRVVDVVSGNRPGARAALRNFLRPIDLGLGVIFALLSGRNQTLGDRIAGTVVVRNGGEGFPVAKPPTVGRKFLAALLLLGAISGAVGVAMAIPEISSANRAVLEVVGAARAATVSGEYLLVHDRFATAFQREMPLERLPALFEDQRAGALFQLLDLEKLKFVRWMFAGDQVAVYGLDGTSSLVFVFQKEGDPATWKVLSMVIDNPTVQ